MQKQRNYKVTPKNDFINTSWKDGQFCGSNGQCIICQEWIGDKLCHPELERNERGFAACPRCGGSYGKDALTGDEYAEATRG